MARSGTDGINLQRAKLARVSSGFVFPYACEQSDFRAETFAGPNLEFLCGNICPSAFSSPLRVR